jgi:tRNA (guanine37-N1)-methyltransferase
MFDSFVSHSIMKRAIQKGAVSVRAHDLREYTHDRHRTCDDKPFGGGPGMLLKPEPIFEAYEQLFGKQKRSVKNRTLSRSGKAGFRFIYMSPQGRPFDQKTAARFARSKHLAFLCGRYEGVDERVIKELVTDEVSIGDYVLTGGELPAMVVIDAVVRLVKGVLGREESKEFESFSQNLLEYPQYTRPSVYRGFKVPSVLLSGNHKEIERWRQKEAHRRTLKRRPDLFGKQSRAMLKS